MSGYIVDFLTIKTPKGFRIFRVFDFPSMSIKDTEKNLNFSISFYNPGKSVSSAGLLLSVLQTDRTFKPTD